MTPLVRFLNVGAGEGGSQMRRRVNQGVNQVREEAVQMTPLYGF